MPRRHHYTHGTFLTSLVIGLLVIIMLILISIPGIRRMRADDARQACVENLARISAAKEHYAVDHELSRGATIPLAALIKDGKELKAEPVCPLGGKYAVNAVGRPPTCSYDQGHVLPTDKPAVTVVK